MNDAIVYFDDFEGPNEHRFLSNFYADGPPLMLGGRDYATAEHLFQAFKARTRKQHDIIRFAESPHDTKYLGRTTRLRSDWDAVKFDVMRVALRMKFSVDSHEARLLLHTEHRLLVEGNTWGDDVWGVVRGFDAVNAKTPGRNWLGTLLMARRAELLAYESCIWQPDITEAIRSFYNL